jgi:hypothetical protein
MYCMYIYFLKNRNLTNVIFFIYSVTARVPLPRGDLCDLDRVVGEGNKSGSAYGDARGSAASRDSLACRKHRPHLAVGVCGRVRAPAQNAAVHEQGARVEAVHKQTHKYESRIRIK